MESRRVDQRYSERADLVSSVFLDHMSLLTLYLSSYLTSRDLDRVSKALLEPHNMGTFDSHLQTDKIKGIIESARNDIARAQEKYVVSVHVNDRQSRTDISIIKIVSVTKIEDKLDSWMTGGAPCNINRLTAAAQWFPSSTT